MSDRLKSKRARILHAQPIRFFVNIYRFIKVLYLSPLLSISDIQKLHDVWLKTEKHDRNESQFLQNTYCEQILTDPKSMYRSKEYSISSQNGEDGLLLYIYSKIGLTNRWFVEFGAGGATSNTRLLATSFGWNGLSLDGDDSSIREVRCHYEGLMTIDSKRVLIAEASWLTCENINDILKEKSIPNEFDLLSIDIDGVDFWLWKILEVSSPRVVVVEYNASLGPEEDLVIPYQDSFFRWDQRWHPNGWYYGASLAAWSKLADKKGYALLACESTGVNAFFVRRDLLTEDLPIQSVDNAYYPDLRRSVRGDWVYQLNSLRSYPWSKSDETIKVVD